jgi:hypothetical protein
MTATQERLQHLLHNLIVRFGGAIEFWTVACLSRGDLGNPADFVDSQWSGMLQEVQELRTRLAEMPLEPPPIVHEQIAKLLKLCADLRDTFDQFLQPVIVPDVVEVAVLKLGYMWRELRLRCSLIAAMIPLPPPLPGITTEQETYYQGILDSLYDRFTANPR